MAGNRRYEGGPQYALETVHLLARIKQIRVTDKARAEAAAELPRNIAQHSEAIRSTLLALAASHWEFSEENERGWVDVYRILKFNRLLWVKIKLETRFSKETVIVISFHHFDDGIPV
jgi:hypothetical protein